MNDVNSGYTAEIRFGVVMYGGVSLAIYINGVSNELFELVCATPRDGSTVVGDPQAGAREAYRRLSLLAGDESLVRAYAQRIRQRTAPGVDVWQEPQGADIDRTRFTIDVIAGSSAGGINGIFLAKALANAEPFSPLADLWVRDGDIGSLLNDPEAYDGALHDLKKANDPPRSLLSSDRMYLKLCDALDAGSGDAAQGPPPTSPLVDELDLFVTTTDIIGTAVPLRLADQVVLERRHRQRFHFSYSGRDPTAAAGNDFSPRNHSFLAFAARCTSSFPFAFEPMTLQRAHELKPLAGRDASLWTRYFDEMPPAEQDEQRLLTRPFSDGGILDNKPFSYVVDTLSRRFGDAPAQRKLLYVEPDPEAIDASRPDSLEAPDALDNVKRALFDIPMVETIREDLETILRRNRRIDWVETIARLTEEDIEDRRRAKKTFHDIVLVDGQVPVWRDLSLDAMVQYHGQAFMPYRRLRVMAVTDWLTERLAAAWKLDDESWQFEALRMLIRDWRDQHYADKPARPEDADKQGTLSSNAFLDDYDFDYRLRRLSFLLRRIDQLTRLARRAQQRHAGGEVPALSTLAERVMRTLAPAFDGTDPLDSKDSADALFERLRELRGGLLASYRALVALRRRQRRGEGIGEAAPAALLETLKRVVGRVPAAGAGAHDVAGSGDAALDRDPSWLQTFSPTLGLQDSMFHRVPLLRQWSGAAGVSMRQVFGAVERALAGMLLAGTTAATGATDATAAGLATEAWKTIGSPTLVPDKHGPRQDRGALLETTPTSDPIVAGLRRLLGAYYLDFDIFDQVRFPLYHDTGTGEPAPVDVLRVSPDDARFLRAASAPKPKLAGTGLAHFSAFLDERWRRNDIMWGRLDAVERLIHSVLSSTDGDTKTVREELMRLAQANILRETLVEPYRAELTQALLRALPEVAQREPLARRIARLLDTLTLRDHSGKAGSGRLGTEVLAAELQKLVSEEALREFAGHRPTFDRELKREPSLRIAARVVSVTGGVLDGVGARVQAAQPVARWLVRAGLVLQGALAVSIPGSLRQGLWRHALTVLYLVLALLCLMAWLFDAQGLLNTSLAALVTTATLHLASLLLGDYLRQRNILRRIVVGLMIALVLGLMGTSVAAWHHWGVGAVCGPAPDPEHGGAWTWVSKLCNWKRP